MAKFLIADDSHGKMMLLQGMLHRAGWTDTVLIAETTEEAETHIDTHPDIAFAFIDYYMPSANGPAVIARLKAANPASRIALVSSADNAENRDDAIAAGAEAFVCTSWPADEVEKGLMDVLREWLG